MNTRALCMITVRPNVIWCDFLNSFSKYDIFIVMDDNKFDCDELKKKYKNINFIQVENEKCKANGYKNSNFATLNKPVSGWDKALYYFGIENNNYEYVWFTEDDVFFYNEDTIVSIDGEYTNSDLLCKKTSTNGDKWYHWNHVINTIEYQPPLKNGMMCIVRFSKKMIGCINDYALKYNKICFLEAFFPTIAMKHTLKCNHPGEFETIHYRYNHMEVNKKNLYHPVKNIEMHTSFRQ